MFHVVSLCSVTQVCELPDFDSGLADTVSGKLQNNNIYTIAKRNVEGQDMLYQSLKLTNGIWILAELRIQPGNPNYTVEYSPITFWPSAL